MLFCFSGSSPLLLGCESLPLLGMQGCAAQLWAAAPTTAGKARKGGKGQKRRKRPKPKHHSDDYMGHWALES